MYVWCQHLPSVASVRGWWTQLIEEQLTGQTRQLKILVCLDHFVHRRATNCWHLHITSQCCHTSKHCAWLYSSSHLTVTTHYMSHQCKRPAPLIPEVQFSETGLTLSKSGKPGWIDLIDLITWSDYTVDDSPRRPQIHSLALPESVSMAHDWSASLTTEKHGSPLISMAQDWPASLKTDQHRSPLTSMAQDWPAWLTTDQHGSRMNSMAHHWSAWLTADQHRSRLTSIAHHWPAWLKIDQHASRLTSMAHHWPAWLTTDQHGSRLTSTAHYWPASLTIEKHGSRLTRMTHHWPAWLTTISMAHHWSAWLI